MAICNKVSDILMYKHWIVDVKSTFYCLSCVQVVDACLEEFTLNPETVRNRIHIANFHRSKKFILLTFYPLLKKLFPLQKCLNSSDLYKFLTFWEILISPIRFELQIFYPMSEIFQFGNKYFLRCLFLKFRLIFVFRFVKHFQDS